MTSSKTVSLGFAPPKVTSADIMNSILNSCKPKQKFAPVVPYHFYQQFLLNGYTPDSVLLLAHDVVANKDAYEELFKEGFWDKTTIFMDNSLVELKKAVDVSMVEEAVNIIGGGAKNIVVILPDAMADGSETINLVKNSHQDWAWRFRECQLLGVIQGSTMKDFLRCAEALEPYDLDWVSIPRVTEQLFGYHRKELISFVDAIFPAETKLHLLGFSDYIWEDLRAAGHSRVLSIDSAVPFRMATMNVLSAEVPPRGNWWEEAKFEVSMLSVVDEINRLINNFGA